MGKSESEAAIEILNIVGSLLPATVVKHAAGLGFFTWQEFGLGIGGSTGQGFVIARTSDTDAPGPITWSGPVHMTLTGAHAGLTVGYRKVHAVLAITTKEALADFSKDLVLGVDVNVLLPPVAFDGIVEEWKSNSNAVVPFTVNKGFKLELAFAGTQFRVNQKAMSVAYPDGLTAEQVYAGAPVPALKPVYDRLNHVVHEYKRQSSRLSDLMQDAGVHVVDNKWRMGS